MLNFVTIYYFISHLHITRTLSEYLSLSEIDKNYNLTCEKEIWNVDIDFLLLFLVKFHQYITIYSEIFTKLQLLTTN